MEKVGFVYQFEDFDAELADQLAIFTEDIPNLFDFVIEIGFHD